MTPNHAHDIDESIAVLDSEIEQNNYTFIAVHLEGFNLKSSCIPSNEDPGKEFV